MTFKQTWWDNNLPNRIEEFNTWVGDKTAQSKVVSRKYIKDKEYKTLIDLGCGNATEYFAYKEEYPELEYLGIDSSEVLYIKNTKQGVPMLLAPAEDTGLTNNHSEIIFARHILEHQPSFQPVLSEMIRLASKEAMHIFFISPGINDEHIGYDSNENLYHNRYNRLDIETFLSFISKVKSFEWIKINDSETMLSIIIK